MKSKGSRAKAIAEKCKDCIYDSGSPGTWRKQVEDCTNGPNSRAPCALWDFRPKSNYKQDDISEESEDSLISDSDLI